MAYRVAWDSRAIDELAKIWLAARDRTRVDSAVQMLDAALKSRPLSCGESRDGDSRIAFAPPLACRFSVDALRNHVLVESIWRPR